MLETFDEICIVIIIVIGVAFLSVLASAFINNRPLEKEESYVTFIEPVPETLKPRPPILENKREKINMGNNINAYVDEDGDIYL